MSSPSADLVVRVRCPGCSTAFKLKGAVRPGKRVKCPQCAGEIVIPEFEAKAKKSASASTAAPKPAPAKKPKKATEDDWLDDLSALDETAIENSDTAVLPPRTGAPPPRKAPARTIDTGPPRGSGHPRREPSGFSLGAFGPLVGCVCGGLIGGAIGAGVWAGIALATGYELGFIAWAIGALTGIGVRVGSGGDDGPLLGGLAVLIAFASIGIGKAASIYLIANNMGAFPPDASFIKIIYVCCAMVPLMMGFWDILWFGLAGLSAFKIGSGLVSDD